MSSTSGRWGVQMQLQNVKITNMVIFTLTNKDSVASSPKAVRNSNHTNWDLLRV